MKLRVMVLLTFVALALAPPLGAQNSSPWVPLFNGKDLTGWKNNGHNKFVVESGTIIGESTTKEYGYLTTDKTYRNFNLKLQFKPLANGNSGVFTRSKIIGMDPEHGPDIEGMQVEVDPSVGNHTGGIYESGGRGWLIQPTAEGEKALKPGQWNTLEIEVHGNHYVTRLNGVQMVDYTDTAPKFTDGVIGLQLHMGGGVKMQWRKIELQQTAD
jgi:hypothetical protein